MLNDSETHELSPEVRRLRELAETLLQEHDGVITIPLRELKEAVDVGKLGIQVRQNIETALLDAGVGVYPTPLPNSENASVRLYRRGTKVALLIQNVGRLNASGDIYLRQFEKGQTENPEREAIQKIRQVLDELK